MTKSRAILGGPFLAALVGTVFCVWIALGNDVNFCVTTGCILYQDFNIGGISLWWFGTAAFLALASCGLFGLASTGKVLGAIFLACDALLLLLMSLTAPCVSCLIVAALLALTYWLFRRRDISSVLVHQEKSGGISILLLVWLALFVINLGQILRSQVEIWPILDESGDPRGKMFFSPSCRYCIEGINVLAGNVNMAFYPVAETEDDVFKLLNIRELLASGDNLPEAMAKSSHITAPGFFSSLSPGLLLFRFHLLCNKAHVYAAGSRGVPFFEYLGLPPEVRKTIENRDKQEERPARRSQNQSFSGQPRDASLPAELLDGQCDGSQPCP